MIHGYTHANKEETSEGRGCTSKRAFHFALTATRFQRGEAVGKKERRPAGNSRSSASFVP